MGGSDMSKISFSSIMKVFVVVGYFMAGCGGGGNAANNNITAADAGPNQNVVAGSLVAMDGSKSTGADGSLITYQWSMVSKPLGSAAALSSATVVNPTFTADLAGSYVLNLVVSDGKVNSAPSTVTITASVANAAPVANAGTPQSVTPGAVVTLNGSGSSDANGDPLTYSWAFTSKPDGSSAVLSNANVVNPTFTADLAGSYVLNLVVSDGKVNSAPSTVTITASVANAAPVANAGTPQSVTPGAVVTLNGSGSSDANGDPLTYSWAFTSKPDGSSAVLSNANVVNPTFTADLAGSYVLNLVVSDGKVNSAPAAVTVTAFVEYVAFGSSTTEGVGDDYLLDDTSLDERNTGGGFEPILNDLLTSATGIPHSIVNEGHGGYTTTDALVVLPTVLANHPNTTFYLILFGSNDAGESLPSGLGLEPGDPGYNGSYKNNMQSMIDAILAAGKTPYLAKLAYTLLAVRNTTILLYNQVIDELVVSNEISVTPPDLYSWFEAHPEQLSDTLHPNGIGYQWIAKFWKDALVPVP
jgi:lysophospholipase L1-like esterase